MKKVGVFVALVFVVYGLALSSLVADAQTKSNWHWPAGELSISGNL